MNGGINNTYSISSGITNHINNIDKCGRLTALQNVKLSSHLKALKAISLCTGVEFDHISPNN